MSNEGHAPCGNKYVSKRGFGVYMRAQREGCAVRSGGKRNERVHDG